MGALDKLAKPAETRGSDIFDIDALPEDNRVAFNLLFFNLKDGWVMPFALMLLMSAGIATLGLSEDSAATVIGAMIVAPLGQPILALGAAVAIGWLQQMGRMLAIVILGAIGVVATGYLLNTMLPPATGSSQVLTRTAPDLRDLGIAIFAAVAGAYGYYRSEFSSVLAGVAIAVSLVPPLCVTGMILHEDKLILAYGSFLLFLTNFAGITLSSLLVFFLGGCSRTQALVHRWGNSHASFCGRLAGSSDSQFRQDRQACERPRLAVPVGIGCPPPLSVRGKHCCSKPRRFRSADYRRQFAKRPCKDRDHHQRDRTQHAVSD